MADERTAVDVNTATEKLISLLPDDFVDRGMDALDDVPPDNSDAETPGDESEEPTEPTPEESETPDDDGESEGDDEGDEDEGETDDETPQTFTVKVSGQEFEVTAEELVAGYQRQKDYTQKTMKLSEDRKALETDTAQLREARDEYAARLKDVRDFLERTQPKEPNWDSLRQENPAEFAARWAEKQQRENALADIKAEENRIAEEQKKEQAEKLQSHLVNEREKLYAAIPSWKDKKIAAAEQKAMLEFAENTLGLTKDDVGQFTDHRAFLLLRDAMKYHELTSKGKEVVRKKAKGAPVLRPGQPRPKPKGKAKELEIARKRLKKSGRVEDAARAFELMLPDDM